MFKKIVEFFTGKKTDSKYAHPLDAVTKPAVPQAPYKLEPPHTLANEPPRCGCGRSASGYCVGLHKLTPEQWDTHDSNPDRVTKVTVATVPKNKTDKPSAKKPAAKKPAAKKPVEKKPAEKKTTKTQPKKSTT